MDKLRAIIIIVIGVAVLAVVSFIYQDFFEESQPTHGSSGDNVSGWGYSDTIGWIAFNCTDCDGNPSCTRNCGNSNFGVNVDLGTGNFSGYAWSDNIGWIDFAPASGFPSGVPNCADTPNYSAKYDLGTDEVNGWIRAELCKTGGNCNGWDGWILLGNESNTCWTNQISINADTAEFEGWAWGSDVIGWISFNCKGPDMCGD